MKLVSVIVPVYNVEKYIDKCVHSLISQDFPNLEIILVDDGSTDSSGKKCDEWKQKDHRISVIHKRNGGLSDARNAGLEIATGDYVGFVDSDDYIETDMYSLLVEAIEKYDADISCCRYSKVFSDGRVDRIGDNHQINVFEEIDCLKEYLYGKNIDPFVCNKLYKASLVNGNKSDNPIRFINGIVGEDNPFNTQILQRTHRMVVVGESKYNYLQSRPGAITNNVISQKKIDSILWWNSIRVECKQKYPELEKYALRRQMIFYIGLYKTIWNMKNYQQLGKDILSFIKEHKQEVLQDDLFEKEIKVSVIMLTTVPHIFLLLLKTYKLIFGSAEKINRA